MWKFFNSSGLVKICAFELEKVLSMYSTYLSNLPEVSVFMSWLMVMTANCARYDRFNKDPLLFLAVVFTTTCVRNDWLNNDPLSYPLSFMAVVMCHMYHEERLNKGTGSLYTQQWCWPPHAVSRWRSRSRSVFISDINFDHHKCQQECCRLNKVSLGTWQLCWSPHASGRACWRKPACISHPSPNNSESDEVNNLNLAENGIAGLAVFRTSGSTYLSKFNPSSSCYGLLNPLPA